MTENEAHKNSIIFTSQGFMHCGLLSLNKYTCIIVNLLDCENQNILDKIYNQINDLYEKNLINEEKLVIRLYCKDALITHEIERFLDLFNKKGFYKIEFVTADVSYDAAIQKMLKENRAAICLQLNYNEKPDDLLIKTLKMYLEHAKVKNDINIHCLIKDINNVTDNDIQNFIKSVYKIGISKIGLRVDKKYFVPFIPHAFSENLTGIFLNFFKTAKKYSFIIDMNDKNQNEFLRKLFKIKKPKKVNLRKKIKNYILRREENYEI